MAVGPLWPQANLKLGWHLDGNSNDYSGNAFNGTDTAITYSLANGKFSQGAGYDGTTSKIAIPALGLGNNVTFMFWFTSTDVTAIQTTAYNNSADTMFVNMQIAGVTTKRINTNFYDGANQIVTGITDLVNNTWYLFTAVMNASGTCYIYLNGKVEGSIAMGAKASLGAQFGQFLGAARTGTSEFWKGAIDEFVVFNTGFSTKQVKDYYAWASGERAMIV